MNKVAYNALSATVSEIIRLPMLAKVCLIHPDDFIELNTMYAGSAGTRIDRFNGIPFHVDKLAERLPREMSRRVR